MKSFEPIYSFRHGAKQPGIFDHETGKFYPRTYSDIDLGSLARWLNERRAAYPLEIQLQPILEAEEVAR